MSEILDSIIALKVSHLLELEKIKKAEVLKDALDTLVIIQDKITSGKESYYYQIAFNSIKNEMNLEIKFSDDEIIKVVYPKHGSIINDCLSNDLIIIENNITDIINNL